MKVLGFVGSGRIGGNTDKLVQQALAGAAAKRAETRIFHLNKMNIKGCQSCNYCKRYDSCIIEDDMQEIYKEIVDADAIVIGSPIYMMQLSAQTKLFIDRLYAFRNIDSSTKISPKKLMLIYGCKYPDPNAYKQYFQLMESLFNYLRLFKIENTVTVGGLIGENDILNNSEIMQKAKVYGENLADTLLS